MALAMSKGINCPEPGLEGHGWPRYSGPRFQLPPRVTKCLDKAQIASSCPSIHDHPANSFKVPCLPASSLDTALAISKSIGDGVLAQLPSQSTRTRLRQLVSGLVNPTTAFDLLLDSLGSLAIDKKLSTPSINFNGHDGLRQVGCGWRLTILHRLRSLHSTYELSWLPTFAGSGTSPKPLTPENEQYRPSSTVGVSNLSFLREVFGTRTMGLLRKMPIVGQRENPGFGFGLFDAVHVALAFRTRMSPSAGSRPGPALVLSNPNGPDNSRKRKGNRAYSAAADGNDSEDEMSESTPSGPSPKRTRTNTKTNNARWACHYFKLNPVKYRSCLERRLSAPRYVKGHLLRHHLQAVHCPTCKQLFEDCGSRDAHITQRQCNFVEPSAEFKQRISEDQEKELKNLKGGDDGCGTWFKIWVILFPKAPEPASPLVTDADWDKPSNLNLIQRAEPVMREGLRNVGGLDVEQIMRIVLGALNQQLSQTNLPTETTEQPLATGDLSNAYAPSLATTQRSLQGSRFAAGIPPVTPSSGAAATPHINPNLPPPPPPPPPPPSQPSASVTMDTLFQVDSNSTAGMWSSTPGLEDFQLESSAANDSYVVPQPGQNPASASIRFSDLGQGFPQGAPNANFGYGANSVLVPWPSPLDVTTLFSHAPTGWMTGYNAQQMFNQHTPQNPWSVTASNIPQQRHPQGQGVQRNQTRRPATTSNPHPAGSGTGNQL